jgi:hypothetical protein
VEEQILKEKRILEKTLEGLRKCDCKACFPLFARVFFELLEEFTHFLPFASILLLGLFVRDVGQGVVDLFEGTF